MINTEITDVNSLIRRCIVYDGFVFTSVTYPGNVYDGIVIRNPENSPCSSPRIICSHKTLQEHIDFINKYQIEKALIIAENIEFIKQCPCLKYVKVIPSDEAAECFDYSPLYEMPCLKGLYCTTTYGKKNEYFTSIDYAKVKGLEAVSISGSGHINYSAVSSLKTLGISGYSENDLYDMFSSSTLDNLMIIQCKIKSLDGLQNTQNLRCMYLYHNKFLQDISALRSAKKTIRALRIENCKKIKDFSVLNELENLEFLELSGDNKLPSLDFIASMKSLKTFVFSMDIVDGDLSPCLHLVHARSLKNRKHYNIMDKDLPKGPFIYGNESVECWRRYK